MSYLDKNPFKKIVLPAYICKKYNQDKNNKAKISVNPKDVEPKTRNYSKIFEKNKNNYHWVELQKAKKNTEIKYIDITINDAQKNEVLAKENPGLLDEKNQTDSILEQKSSELVIDVNEKQNSVNGENFVNAKQPEMKFNSILEEKFVQVVNGNKENQISPNYYQVENKMPIENKVDPIVEKKVLTHVDNEEKYSQDKSAIENKINEKINELSLNKVKKPTVADRNEVKKFDQPKASAIEEIDELFKSKHFFPPKDNLKKSSENNDRLKKIQDLKEDILVDERNEEEFLKKIFPKVYSDSNLDDFKNIDKTKKSLDSNIDKLKFNLNKDFDKNLKHNLKDDLSKKIDVKNYVEPIKSNKDLDGMSFYELIIHLNDINPRALTEKEKNIIFSSVSKRILHIKKLLKVNKDPKVFVSAKNIIEALLKSLYNIKSNDNFK